MGHEGAVVWLLMLVVRSCRKSKRKSERKANSGRKGTVDEEKYLLTSIVKLATARIVATRGPSTVSYSLNFSI